MITTIKEIACNFSLSKTWFLYKIFWFVKNEKVREIESDDDEKFWPVRLEGGEKTADFLHQWKNTRKQEWCNKFFLIEKLC